MIDYNDLVRGTMSDIRDPIQSVLDPNSEGFRVFDEFVIDSSVELIVNHRDVVLTRGEPQEINKMLWNRSREARLGIQPFWQRLIQKMRDFGVMEEFSEKEADLIQWVTSEERRNHLERYSWTEGLRAYLIQGFTNWDFGAEHSDEVLALLTELADAEDRQKAENPDGQSFGEDDPIFGFDDGWSEEWQQKARKFLLDRKNEAYGAVHEMLYTERKHAELMSEKDRKLRVLFPLRIADISSDRFERLLGLDFCRELLMIERLYQEGAQIHILWMDDMDPFDDDGFGEERRKKRFDQIQDFINRRKRRKRGNKRGSITYYLESTLRKKMDEGSSFLKEIRLLAFYDLLLERRPTTLEPGNDMMQWGRSTVLDGKRVQSMITILLWNLYGKLTGGVMPFDLIVHSHRELVSELEGRRCLKKHAARMGPRYNAMLGEDGGWMDVLFIPPFVGRWTWAAEHLLLATDWDSDWTEEEWDDEVSEEDVVELAKWFIPDERHNLRRKLNEKLRKISKQYNAMLDEDEEWMVKKIFDVDEPSELSHRLGLFFPKGKMVDFENMVEFLNRVWRYKKDVWVEMHADDVRVGEPESHKKLVRKLKNFGIEAQPHFDLEKERKTTKGLREDDVVICNNPIYCIREKKRTVGKPLEIQVKKQVKSEE